MKLIKLIYLVPIFIFSLSFSQSEEWKYIGESVSNAKYYYRNLEIDKIGYYRTWVKSVLPDKTVKGKTIPQGYEINLWQVDCDEKRFKLLAYVTYDSNGEVLKSGNLYNDFSYIVPDSMADLVSSIICKN